MRRRKFSIEEFNWGLMAIVAGCLLVLFGIFGCGRSKLRTPEGLEVTVEYFLYEKDIGEIMYNYVDPNKTETYFHIYSLKSKVADGLIELVD